MGSPNSPSPDPTDDLLQAVARGDTESLGLLLDRDRDRLRRMVALRMDHRLAGRIDPSDVIQDAQLEAARRLKEYLNHPTMPFFLWLRLITGQRIAQLHRLHLGAQMRSVGRELSLSREPFPEASSAALAANLMGRFTDPPDAVIRSEIRTRLQDALNELEPVDREVLALRHFEHLSNTEAAQELGISEEACKKRHLRAIRRLKTTLDQLPGGAEGFQS